MITRNLDGCYFRISRNGEYVNVCFSDMTREERKIVMLNRSTDWLKSLCNHLGDCLHNVGDEFDIVGDWAGDWDEM